MALWFNSSQLGYRRDIQITDFHRNQNFTVRNRILLVSLFFHCFIIQEYTIEICLDNIRWHVKKRYSEFAEFHEKLLLQVANIDAKSLPPKKLLNKNSLDFIHRRRLALDNYLKYLFQFFTMNSLPLPDCLVKFLDFHLYVKEN